MSQDGSSKGTLAQPLSLTASIEEFKQLSLADQARMRALAFMANKQWGSAYASTDYPDHGIESSRKITGMARAYLENAGDLFLDQPLGLFDLARLVAEGSAWTMGLVMSALTLHLDEYTLHQADGTITRSI